MLFFFHDLCLAIFLDVWELDIWYFGLHRYGYNCYDEGMASHWLLSGFGWIGKYLIKQYFQIDSKVTASWVFQISDFYV